MNHTRTCSDKFLEMCEIEFAKFTEVSVYRILATQMAYKAHALRNKCFPRPSTL